MTFWGIPTEAAMPMQERRRNAAYREYILTEWKQAQDALEKAKTLELELRNEMISVLSDKAGDQTATGTENVPTPYGTLKIVHKLNYTLGNADLVDKALDQIEKSQEGGNVIAERLVKWKPELSISEYKLLNPKQRAMIDAVLTVKPATPSVKLEAVKGKA